MMPLSKKFGCQKCPPSNTFDVVVLFSQMLDFISNFLKKNLKKFKKFIATIKEKSSDQ